MIGVGRGLDIARSATTQNDLELVALCDTWQSKLEKVGHDFGVATYTDFDRFLEHDIAWSKQVWEDLGYPTQVSPR